MVPLYNGFYPFPLSRAVNLNSLIFDPSELKIVLFLYMYLVVAIYLYFELILYPCSYFVCASSEGCGETVQSRLSIHFLPMR